MDRPVAFANLWETSDKSELSVDLMRHGSAAPRSVMDYLFVELMLWGKSQGYAWFNLGMAPLAGLEVHRLAPAWHKIGRLVYRLGSDFYNFDGLRGLQGQVRPAVAATIPRGPGALCAGTRHARRDHADFRRRPADAVQGQKARIAC